jgi:CheY-like chemotaxis protein
MFDSGQLQGKLNPLTRQRLIRADSVEAVMTAHGLQGVREARRPRILLASVRDDVRQLALDRVQAAAGLALEFSTSGAETLVHCARKPPQLLMLDGSLPDLSSSGIIAALRQQSEREAIPIVCLASEGDEAAVQAAGATLILPYPPRLTADTLDQALTDILGLQKPAPSKSSHFEHQRRSPRMPVDLRAEVVFYTAQRPRRSAHGVGQIRNLSQTGAFIDHLHIETTDILSRPFRLMVALQEPPWAGWKAYCRVVRLTSNGELSAGVEFIRTPRRHQEQLVALSAGTS